MRSKTLGILALISMIAALWAIFIYAPTERTMGNIQRIFYAHLSNAMLGYLSVFVLFTAAMMYLIKGDSKWDRLAYCSAEIGVLATGLNLLTGMLWAKPVWGIWWTWDPRLTLQFVLWLIFVSYFMLRAYLPDREKKARLSAVFGVLGMINVPINYMSIRLWRTQHPQPVIGGGGLDTNMWVTLIITFVAFGLLYTYFLDRRLSIAKVEEEVEYLEHVVHAQ